MSPFGDRLTMPAPSMSTCVADIGRSTTLEGSRALTVFGLSMYELLIAGSLVADLPAIGKFAEISATGSLVEETVVGCLETGRAPVTLSSASFGFFAGLPVPYLSASSRRFVLLELVD